MSDLVEIRHPDIEGTGHIPATALERWIAKGWEPVDKSEPTPQLPADLGADNPPEASKSRPASTKRSNA